MAFKDYKRFIYPGSHSLVEEVANWEFIDSLDFTHYLRLGIENIADFIEYAQQDMICNKGVILPECCDGEFLTNYIGDYEFGEYIVSRYPDIVLRVREECYDVYNQDYGYFFVYNVKALYENPEDVKNLKFVVKAESSEPRYLKLENNQRLYFAVSKTDEVHIGDLFEYCGFTLGSVVHIEKQRGLGKKKILTILVDTSLIKNNKDNNE